MNSLPLDQFRIILIFSLRPQLKSVMEIYLLHKLGTVCCPATQASVALSDNFPLIPLFLGHPVYMYITIIISQIFSSIGYPHRSKMSRIHPI